ncbi:expressed unknown protein [Seminavis robusta]|uniref:Uncharacterized protein n=1 Tax=Seminavis robusta TaxID=568900 RepID=A0A9N8HJ78_9STRA|nr:expressed unknown protein [Seminavis robusta]|eukprot:Sro747_g196480.1 n/a (1260) ;mRNA; r:5907-9968
MGNTSSLTSAFQTGTTSKGAGCVSSGSSGKKSKGSKTSAAQAAESATERAKKVFGDVHESLKISVKKLEEQDHPAAHLIDTVCGPYFDTQGGSNHRHNRKMRENRSASFYSEDYNSDDSRTISEDEQTLDTDYNASTVNGSTVASSTAPNKKTKEIHTDSSYLSQSDYESSEVGRSSRHRSSKSKRRRNKEDDPSSTTGQSEDDDSKTMDTSISMGQGPQQLLSKPLASSFAKRCYFTKAGIGKNTQHYEGLTLTGNVVLMLAAAMKLKGCPTICDEDLRRVEQTYPNQFSRLPDELLLSSGWRRISKYCHFSNKPVPDGIPFFHSKQRIHPQGGYYFLLAAAVGMVRPIDVEPLTRDTLVLLETDYPTQCDAAPEVLIQDPEEWTLVDKFCFFSGGPINTEEDVFYQADFDGNPIYMLAFLSPSLTPEELYKLEAESEDAEGNPIPGLTSVVAVQDVESVYDLTERDFHDLKLYHLGPCRALPQYILQPQAWTKVLPPHFLEARHRAVLLAQEYEMANGGPVTPVARDPMAPPAQQLMVGATPLDRYDQHQPPPPPQQPPYTMHGADPNQNPPYDEHAAVGVPPPPHHPHHHPYSTNPHHNPPPPPPHTPGGPEDAGYFMSPRPPVGPPDHHHYAGGPQPSPQPGFSSEYDMAAAQHNSASMADPHMSPYPHHLHHPHHGGTPPPHPHQSPYPDSQQNGHHYQQPPSPQQPPYHQNSPSHYSQGSPQTPIDPVQQYQAHQQEDEQSHHSPTVTLEPDDDTQMAPMDEAMDTPRKAGPPGSNLHHQGMDPPEHLPQEPEPDDSVAVSEGTSQNPNSASYYSHPDALEDSNAESQYSPEARSPSRHDAPSFGSPDYSIPASPPDYGTPASPNDYAGTPVSPPNEYDDTPVSPPNEYGTPGTPVDAAPQYSYSVSPGKEEDEYYQDHHPEQSRDDQYYDTPEVMTPDGLKEQPGSQDHEFFNAPSVGEEEDDYEPASSSFDPSGHIGRHPDDYPPDDYQHANPGSPGYYDDEEGHSRLEVQESSSAEYFRGHEDDSPSPIKIDHLRRLGRKKGGAPHNGNVSVTSPSSQASSQNSVSEYSHSSAMRGAQELLKRNRQRRHEQARRRLNASNNEIRTNNSVETEGSPAKSPPHYAFSPDNGYHRNHSGNRGGPRGDDGSASTWESGNSEALTSVISGSSVWTDNSSNPADRSSRRALILQMAKARMKSNKDRDPAEKTIKEEKSNSLDDHDDYDDHSDMRHPGLTDAPTSSATDLDIAADLD